MVLEVGWRVSMSTVFIYTCFDLQVSPWGGNLSRVGGDVDLSHANVQVEIEAESASRPNREKLA